MAGRFVLNRRGVAKLHVDAGVTADLGARMERIASAAGEGVEARVTPGRKRSRAVAITTTGEAARAEDESATLTSSVDAGRGDTHD